MTQECPCWRPLERLLGRGADALTNFFANAGVVLRHFQDGIVFLNRESLIGDSLFQGTDGLVQNPLLVVGGRRGYALLIILLESSDLLDGDCRRVELVVGNVR